MVEEALEVSPTALLVYVFLWDSAWVHHDDENGNSGTTKWSHKGIADKLHLGKATVLKAINGLLDAGLIQHNGYLPTGKGSSKASYRITHPEMLEAQRHAIKVMGPPSGRKQARPNKTNHDSYDPLELPAPQSPGDAKSWQRALDQIRDACAADGADQGKPVVPQHVLDGYARRQEAVCATEGSGAHKGRNGRTAEPFGWNKDISPERRAELKKANAERVARWREQSPPDNL